MDLYQATSWLSKGHWRWQLQSYLCRTCQRYTWSSQFPPLSIAGRCWTHQRWYSVATAQFSKGRLQPHSKHRCKCHLQALLADGSLGWFVKVLHHRHNTLECAHFDPRLHLSIGVLRPLGPRRLHPHALVIEVFASRSTRPRSLGLIGCHFQFFRYSLFLLLILEKRAQSSFNLNFLKSRSHPG